MIKTNGWNWDKVESDFWKIPSEEVYYYLYRWKRMNFNNLLDLGCGLGRHSILFSENGFNVTSYDLSEEGIKILQKEVTDKKLQIKTMIGDIKELNLRNQEFDCILAFHSIYHVDSEDFKKVLKEIYRVLKTDGEMYITMLSKSAYSDTAKGCKIIDENVRLKEEEDGTILPHFFVNYKDIKRLLNRFKIIKIRHIEDFFDGKSSWHYFIHAKRE